MFIFNKFIAVLGIKSRQEPILKKFHPLNFAISLIFCNFANCFEITKIIRHENNNRATGETR